MNSNFNKIRAMYKTCFYCGEKLSKKQRTVDHVAPRKKGGSNKLDNLVVACRKCNWEKDDMDLSEYIKLKLNNFDFSSRYNLNKRPKEYGFEGTIYKTETVSISDMICKPPSQPSSHKIWVRKKRVSSKQNILQTYSRKEKG